MQGASVCIQDFQTKILLKTTVWILTLTYGKNNLIEKYDNNKLIND